MPKNKEFTVGNLRVTFVQNKPVTVAVATYVDDHKPILTGLSQCHASDVWDPMVGITRAFGVLKKRLAMVREEMWFHHPKLLSLPPTQVLEEAFFEEYKKELKG